MAMDAIKQVTQIEQDSQKRRDAAAAAGKLAVVEAQKAVRKLLTETRQEAEAQVRQMMQQAEDQAAEETRKAMAEGERACEKLKEDARTRLEDAAARIVEKVVKD